MSTHHLQKEAKGTVPDGRSFTDWLHGRDGRNATKPFIYDNYTRPMRIIVPDGATVFYFEHGRDPLAVWFDALLDGTDGLQAIFPGNARCDHMKVTSDRIHSYEEEAVLTAQICTRDLKLFDYVLDQKSPTNVAPEAPLPLISVCEHALEAALRPLAQLKGRVIRKIGRW